MLDYPPAPTLDPDETLDGPRHFRRRRPIDPRYNEYLYGPDIEHATARFSPKLSSRSKDLASRHAMHHPPNGSTLLTNFRLKPARVNARYIVGSETSRPRLSRI